MPASRDLSGFCHVGPDCVLEAGHSTRARNERGVSPGQNRGKGGDGAGAPEAPGTVPALPCLFSNNLTEPRPRLTPYQRKNAHSIKENLEFLIAIHGLGKIGFLTLTFPKWISLKDGNERFRSLATHVLDKLFVCWVCVREFTKDGRPHFHLIVVCRDDVREGFDFGAYLEMTRLTARKEKTPKCKALIRELSRELNPSPALRSLWSEMRRVLPLYGFGRHELIPIRKGAEALARYVGGYIRKSMEFRPVEHKGARLISYSKTFPRKVVGHQWSFNTTGAALWRAKVALFAKLHRIKDHDGLSKRFGSRWAWWFKDVISSLNLVPVLPFDLVPAYVAGSDSDAFAAAMDCGLPFNVMHLYRPELPTIEGRTVTPPKSLRAALGFHLDNWNRTPEQIAAVSESERRRVAALPRFHTHEALQAARDAILAAPVLSPAAVRARNYAMLVHPAYFNSNYS